MKNLNFVLDTLSATSTVNFSKTNTPIISIGDGTTDKKQPVCSIYDIKAGSIVKMAAVTSGTAQVTTLTPVGMTNGVTYSFTLNSLNPVTEEYYIHTYTVTTPAVGSITAGSIVNQFVTLVNADPNARVSAANSSSTLVLTAATGYETFSVSISNPGLGLTQSTGTPGVYKFGISPYYDLARTGVDTSSILGAAAGYTLYSWVANQPSGQTNMQATSKPYVVNVWVNNSDSNASALVSAIDTIWSSNIGVVGAVGTR